MSASKRLEGFFQGLLQLCILVAASVFIVISWHNRYVGGPEHARNLFLCAGVGLIGCNMVLEAKTQIERIVGIGFAAGGISVVAEGSDWAILLFMLATIGLFAWCTWRVGKNVRVRWKKRTSAKSLIPS